MLMLCALKVTLSTAAQNPEDFVNLTDSVIEAIKLSTCPGLEKAEVVHMCIVDECGQYGSCMSVGS